MPPKQSQSIIGRITCFRGGHAAGGYYDPVDIDSGDLIEVPVEDIPFVGLMVFNVPQGPFFLKKCFFFGVCLFGGSQLFLSDATLDHVKKYIGALHIHEDNMPEQMYTDLGGFDTPVQLGAIIPTGEWGFWSRLRSVPYNMPIRRLKAQDLPLKFSWHDWTASYATWGTAWMDMLWK